MKEHLKHLETVFSHLQAVNIKIKLSKCQFLHKPTLPRTDEILTSTNLAVPKSIDELHHFPG